VASSSRFNAQNHRVAAGDVDSSFSVDGNSACILLLAGLSMANTAVIQIGNSDNKLTQNNWAHFVASMRSEIERNVYRIHFQGGSDWDAPWQNACWVCEVRSHQIEPLRAAVAKCRGLYQQDSAAVVFGETEFI
jgi:phage terminase large subunit-like protein